VKIRSSHLALRFYEHDGWTSDILEPLVTKGRFHYQECSVGNYWIPAVGTELHLGLLFKIATSVQTWDNLFLVGREMEIYCTEML